MSAFGPYLAYCLSGHKKRHRRPRDQAGKRPSAAMQADLDRLSNGLFSNTFPVSENKHSANVSSDSGPHRRSKRFLSYPRFVEVMVVADSKMVEHHGSNLQHYILTLMSIVSSSWLATRSFDFPFICYCLSTSGQEGRSGAGGGGGREREGISNPSGLVA